MYHIRLCLLLALLGTSSSGVAQERRNHLAFTHVTVIDCTGAPAEPDMTVIIAGDRILALGKSDDVVVPENTIVVDATDKFMIPGLWDMHIHVRTYEAPLFIANGVTGVRIMFGRPRDIKARRQVRNGETFIPDSDVACPPLADESFDLRRDGDVIRVTTEMEAEQAVRTAKEAGFDSVKLSSDLRRELYIAVADEAKRVGIPVVGHVPYSVSAEFASESGQKSVEHLTGIAIGCSRSASDLQALHSQTDDWKVRNDLQRRAIETYDEKTAALLFAKFVENKTWQCPTLTLYQGRARSIDPTILQDARLEFTPNWESDRWNGDRKWYALAAQRETNNFQHSLRLVGAMHQAGVRILAGTDTANPYCYQGFGIHDEMELLVKASLSPLDALQSATRNPAEYMERLDDLGTVENGKIADLVLLDMNPLDDIRHTRQIFGVVLRGHWLPKPTLKQMLSQAKVTAKIENIGGQWSRDITKPHQPVVEVRFSNRRITDEQIPLLREFPELKRLDLSDSQVSDSGLGIATEFPQLQQLSVSRTSITDVGMQHVQTLSGLQSLRVQDVSIGNAGLANLRQLTTLQQLWLDSTKITDEGLESIASLETLHDLSFADTEIGDEGVSHLRSLFMLTNLWLNKTRVSDEGLRHLRNLTHLKVLAVGETRVSDAGLAHITKLTELEHVVLTADQITDDGLQQLSGLRNLKKLNLSHTGVTDAGLKHLSDLSKLEELLLEGTRVSENGIEGLKRILPKLKVSYMPFGQLTVAIAQSADDAEEHSDGHMTVDSFDLELVRDEGRQIVGKGMLVVGLRFSNINILPGSRLKKAYIQFTAREVGAEPTNLTIHGALPVNSGIFRSTPANITSRSKTRHSVAWSPPVWEKAGERGVSQRSPDVAPLITSVISEAGWKRGNAVVLIIAGTGRRVAESYDSNPAAAPTLHVEYEK